MPHLIPALFATATLLTSPVHAQSNYPDRTVKIIVPFAPGGGADVMARLAAGPLALRLKQPFVIENRGGAGGNIGTAAVAQAAPDGYTLLLVTPATTINHTLAAKPGYDVMRDFAPIASWSRSPLLFITATDVPVRDLRELANHVKANPGKLSYASGGVGLITHLVAYSWYGFAAPAQTPARMLDTLNAAMIESLRDDETQKKIEAIGAQPDPMSRDAYTKFTSEELARWAGVVMTAKLKQE